jgi:hypothetical protein
MPMHLQHLSRAFHALLFAVQHVYRRGPFALETPEVASEWPRAHEKKLLDGP